MPQQQQDDILMGFNPEPFAQRLTLEILPLVSQL